MKENHNVLVTEFLYKGVTVVLFKLRGFFKINFTYTLLKKTEKNESGFTFNNSITNISNLLNALNKIQ